MNKIKIILMMIISLFVFAGCSSDDPGKIKLDYSAVENSSNANKIKVEKSVIDSLNGVAPDIVYLDRIDYSEKIDVNDRNNIFLQFHLKENVKQNYDTYTKFYNILIPILDYAKQNNIDNVVILIQDSDKHWKMWAITFKLDQLDKINRNNLIKSINAYGSVNGKLYSEYK